MIVDGWSVVGVGVGPVRVGGVRDGVVGVGVEDGIISLEPNNDFVMGAPPGAPGAIGEGVTPRGLNLEGVRRRNITISGVTPIAVTSNVAGTREKGGEKEKGFEKERKAYIYQRLKKQPQDSLKCSRTLLLPFCLLTQIWLPQPAVAGAKNKRNLTLQLCRHRLSWRPHNQIPHLHPNLIQTQHQHCFQLPLPPQHVKPMSSL